MRMWCADFRFVYDRAWCTYIEVESPNYSESYGRSGLERPSTGPVFIVVQWMEIAPDLRQVVEEIRGGESWRL